MSHLETERKYLAIPGKWKTPGLVGIRLSQAYLFASFDPPRSVRIRICDDQATLCLKTAVSALSRYEWEYRIPLSDARELFDSTAPTHRIEKVRYTFVDSATTWQIDEFCGSNSGLVVAEAEAPPESDEHWSPPRPSWLGTEVSRVKRYLNELLALHPYSSWPPEHWTRTDGSVEDCRPDWPTRVS